MCKNWQAYGKCRFGDKCSFAHGESELRKKENLLSTFKTRQCKQFIETMHCPYGIRCQYIHNQWTVEKQGETKYSKVLAENCVHIKSRLDVLENPCTPPELSEHLFYISTYFKYGP